MTQGSINPNQLSVAKIYPGNYTNVLRYWHGLADVQYRNANGIETDMQNQFKMKSTIPSARLGTDI